MFYYYGRKKQIAKHYPKPAYDTIIEPFAGSAAYALHGDNWTRKVILVEKDAQVAGIWQWLIEEATPGKIMALPSLKVGDRSSEFLHIVHAATKQAFKYKTIKVTPVLERNWEISKRVMAANVHKVKHWNLVVDDYTAAPDVEATWFIDPPYRWPPDLNFSQPRDIRRLPAICAVASEKLGVGRATRRGSDRDRSDVPARSITRDLVLRSRRRLCLWQRRY